jgi:hypothetical protein
MAAQPRMTTAESTVPAQACDEMRCTNHGYRRIVAIGLGKHSTRLLPGFVLHGTTILRLVMPVAASFATLQNPGRPCMMRASIHPSIRIEGYMTQ